MTLRWITWGDEGAWHLRFGTDGPPLCDRYIPGSGANSTGSVRSRSLREGPPAVRCPLCASVISFRLGLTPP
jgi:hypothetical protein